MANSGEYYEDRSLIWDTFSAHERKIKDLGERQDTLDKALTAQAITQAGLRGWLYLSLGLSVILLVLLVANLFLTVQLAQVLR